MTLLDLKRPKEVTTKCHFRIRKNDYGAKIRYCPKYVCENVWSSLFPHLRPGEPWGDLVIWELGPTVSVRPAMSDVDEQHKSFQRCPALTFVVRDYKDERRKLLKSVSNESDPEVVELDAAFRKVLEAAIVDSFKLRSIEEQFRTYNPTGRPFSILVTDADEGLALSEFKVVWKNSKGLSSRSLKTKTQKTKGSKPPAEQRELTAVEKGRQKWQEQKKKEQSKRRKVQGQKKRQEKKERQRKAAMKLPAKRENLKPAIRYPSGTILARCRNTWLKLFAYLYEYSAGADQFDVFVWEADPKKGRVRLAPKASHQLEPARQAVEFSFQVENIDTKSPETFAEWIDRAIFAAFESEKVAVEYSYFNQQDHPFSVFSTDKDGSWSKSRFREVLSEYGGLSVDQVRQRQASLQNDTAWRKPSGSKRRRVTASAKTSDPPATNGRRFNSQWKRFYFDDGVRREYWYIHCQGKKQTILSGSLGNLPREETQSFSAPQTARKDTQTQIDNRLAAGFIAYAPESLELQRKNRVAPKQLEPALKAFEKQRGAKIPEEFRHYLRNVNGGVPAKGLITLPGNSRATVEVGSILGMKTAHIGLDLPYFEAVTGMPPGHVAVAAGEHLCTMDAQGVIYFWDFDQLERYDFDDDNNVHLDRLTPFVVAQSFDEFLTRLATYPKDTQAKPKRVSKPRQLRIPSAESRRNRRFYVDDGRSRKFWHVETDGIKQTTRYGRLGSKGTSNSKTFRDAQMAQAATQQLVEEKLQKGYLEVIPESLKFRRTAAKRATAASIQQLEKEIGSKLPEDFKRFLLEINGGEPLPGFIEIPCVPHIRAVEVAYLFGIDRKSPARKSLSWANEVLSPLFPTGHVPIAMGSDVFTLSLKRNPGAVFFWDHDTSDVIENDEGEVVRYRAGAGVLLAHSFDEFLARLADYQSS